VRAGQDERGVGPARILIYDEHAENQQQQGCKPLSGGFDVQLVGQAQFIEHFWLLWALS
jgi:hypothetical protein